jgi:class I fructose-bisphosphate aldolase
MWLRYLKLMRSLADSPLTRDDRTLLLAMDHGLEHGPSDFSPVPETVDPETVFDIGTHDAVTAIAVQKGIAETYYPSYEEDVSLLLKLNGGTNMRMGEPTSPLNCSVEYAAEIGADAVGYTLYPGSNHEPGMFEAFREVQEAARAFDLPVAAWSYPRGQGVKNDTSSDVVAYAARTALELGADVAKVKYPGDPEAMSWATRAAGDMNVLLSGGSKTDDRAFLSRVETALDAGAAGLAVGRNVWQRDDPTRILDALERLIFEDASVDASIGVTA